MSVAYLNGVVDETLISPTNTVEVIFFNNDHTPMTTVVAILAEVFGHPRREAEALTMSIHRTGSAVVARLPAGVAVSFVASGRARAQTAKLPWWITLRRMNEDGGA